MRDWIEFGLYIAVVLAVVIWLFASSGDDEADEKATERLLDKDHE